MYRVDDTLERVERNALTVYDGVVDDHDVEGCRRDVPMSKRGDVKEWWSHMIHSLAPVPHYKVISRD
jgi:hypothetical protein